MNDSDDLINITSSTFDWTSDDMSTGIYAQDILTINPSLVSSITSPSYAIDVGSVTLNSYTTSTIGTITLPDFNLAEFDGIMPPIEKVKEMCDEYPALEKAYENFKLIYKLVHDDWESKLRGDHE